MKVSIVMVVISALLPGMAAGAQIYRCADPSGNPRFQHIPCAGDGEPVKLSSPVVSWDPLRPGERDMLEQRRRRLSAPRSAARRQQDERASERTCWQKRRRLDAVATKLRRGYKAAQGERLRRRRDDLSGFIRRYCD